MQEKDTWLEIHDSELSSKELAAEIARRVELRRETLGQVHLTFPTFGNVSPFPEPPSDHLYNPNLYHHLRRANQMEPPDTAPVLAHSPATQLPILGRFWQMVRRQFHELILFYVNRFVAHETQMDNHLISSLNELTRIVQVQQEEIQSLREMLSAYKKSRP
ncbi:MAG: hypothetical protein R3293_19850 [Candidatus Promineifilaceae bacterium]|nr:hypothetical protein [Candidatus Promineifilaceae bacterium]